MNTQPTPETDAEHARFPMGGFTLDFARKLERERDERNQALLYIARILRDKETQHKDLMIGSTAFKSALSWAEKFNPEQI
jgi:hypothetical protein